MTRTTRSRAHDVTPTPVAPVRGAPATRVIVATLGMVVALAALEHGVGELRQGSGAPASLMIQSWPETPALAPLDGEPAMTVLPDLLLSGALTVGLAVVLAVWAVGFAHRRNGGLVLAGISLLLLLVGGGLFPPVMGVALGLVAERAHSSAGRRPGPVRAWLGARWRALLAVTVTAYLALIPGTVVLAAVAGVDSPALVLALVAVASVGFVVTLVAGLAHDRAACLPLDSC